MLAFCSVHFKMFASINLHLNKTNASSVPLSCNADVLLAVQCSYPNTQACRIAVGVSALTADRLFSKQFMLLSRSMLYGAIRHCCALAKLASRSSVDHTFITIMSPQYCLSKYPPHLTLNIVDGATFRGYIYMELCLFARFFGNFRFQFRGTL